MPEQGEHACDFSVSDCQRFRRKNGIGEVDGKRLDAVLCIHGQDDSEVSSFRYPVSEGWTKAAARRH